MDNCAEKLSQNSGFDVIPSAVRSTSSTFDVDNVVKAGWMKKGKRGKRIYLVLREDSYASPACIQYFESEKRFRKKKPPDYVMKLKEVFNVNRIKHSRMKFALAVFGYKDTLYLGCDVEDDLESWFHTILNVYTGTKSGSFEDDSRPKFDYVWDVTAEVKQIEQLNGLCGPCRLCLTRRSLHVYKKPFPDMYREFPLVSISDYGHNDNYFMIKLGRSADTGPGSIFFKTDDPDGSKNIHDVLLTITGENHDERLRSSSDSSSRRTSTLSSTSRISGSTRSMTDRYSTSLATNSLLPRRTGIMESEKKLKEIRSMFAREGNSPMVLAGGCSRSSISSLSSSGSVSHPGSHRFSRVGSDCINPLPVVKETGGSGSGAEYLPMEKHVETRDDSSSVQPGYAEMKSAVSSTPTPSYHLEEVRSYISDDSFTSAADPLGARAYSLGAKMLPRSSDLGNAGRDSTAITMGAACLDVGVYQTVEDRKRALSFDSRKHYNRMNTPLEKMHDLRLGIDSRCGSFSSTSRRMTDSSRRSNFSEDLVEIDFNHTHSSSTGRSPSNSFSSTDSLTRMRANSGLLFNRFTRRKSNDEVISPASRFVQQQLLNECNQQPPAPSLKAETTQDYVPMDSHAPSAIDSTSAYTVTVTADIEPLPKSVVSDQEKTHVNISIAQSEKNFDHQGVENMVGNYVVMETSKHEPTEPQDTFTNCIEEYAPMDVNTQSARVTSSSKSHLSSLNRSVLPIHNKSVMPIEEEIESVDQTTLNIDRLSTSKTSKSSNSATAEQKPPESILNNDALHYSTLDMRSSATTVAFKSSPSPAPKQSKSTFNNNNDDEEKIVDKVVYAKIQPGNLVVSATER